MNGEAMKFFKSTEHMKKFLILTEIEKEHPLTQSALAKVADVSPAMVNSYIRSLCDHKLVEMQGNNKNMTYLLTHKGVEYRKYLLISLMAELIDMMSTTGMQLKESFLPLIDGQNKKFILYGAGETGQVCARALAEIPEVQVVGFMDDDENLHQKKVLGYRVYSVAAAAALDFDVVIVSSFINEVCMKAKIAPQLSGRQKVYLLAELGSMTWKMPIKENGEGHERYSHSRF